MNCNSIIPNLTNGNAPDVVSSKAVCDLWWLLWLVYKYEYNKLCSYSKFTYFYKKYHSFVLQYSACILFRSSFANQDSWWLYAESQNDANNDARGGKAILKVSTLLNRAKMFKKTTVFNCGIKLNIGYTATTRRNWIKIYDFIFISFSSLLYIFFIFWPEF